MEIISSIIPPIVLLLIGGLCRRGGWLGVEADASLSILERNSGGDNKAAYFSIRLQGEEISFFGSENGTNTGKGYYFGT